ncbi:uncharacterized protein LOC114373966 [Glycine soja]|uniref:Uncharacterized protein n=1 Tax=Glycine soja TaxID=3848 RepID=A0A445I4A9_GLYSO|nr:uncharacterized protein LOC114373966 [Glycine soja]RZB80943.1 hypothetical protein D0Y65_030614 [Glycine soja]
MSPIGLSFLFLISLALLSIARGQERAPHGLVYESPVAFPPTAYDFFHPNAQKPENKDPCVASKCSPLPLVAQVDATQIYENKASTTQKGGKQIGGGGVAGIITDVALPVLLAMGIYYVKVTSQANMSRASNSVQSHAWCAFFNHIKISA